MEIYITRKGDPLTCARSGASLPGGEGTGETLLTIAETAQEFCHKMTGKKCLKKCQVGAWIEFIEAGHRLEKLG